MIVGLDYVKWRTLVTAEVIYFQFERYSLIPSVVVKLFLF